MPNDSPPSPDRAYEIHPKGAHKINPISPLRSETALFAAWLEAGERIGFHNDHPNTLPPIPEPRRPNGVYPFAALAVGEYFDTPLSAPGGARQAQVRQAIAARVRSSARHRAKTNPPESYVTKILTNEQGVEVLRCWRTE